MKKSELKKYIKEMIISELGGAVNLDKNANPADIKKFTSQGIDVNLKENAETDIENKIKSGEIDPKEIEAAAKKAMNGDSTDLALMMAGFGKMFEAKKDEDDIEDDEEKLDKKAQAAAKKGGGKVGKLQRVTAQLKELEKEMKELVGKWKKAEGKEKETLLDKLKEKTKVKKELEALEDKLADAIV